MSGRGRSRLVAGAAVFGLVALGGGLTGEGIYYHLIFGGDTVSAALLVATGLLILLGATYLVDGGVSPTHYGRVFGTTVGGGLAASAVAVGAIVASGSALTFSTHAVAVGFLTGVGAIGGLVAGIQSAHAQAHARRADQAETTADRLSEERGRFAVLNETTRDLLDVPDRESVAQRLVEEGRVGLPGPLAGVWLYDTDRERLMPAATTSTDPDWTPSPLWPDSEAIAAFESGTTREISGPEFPPNETLLAVPMGDHGLLVVGAPDGFDAKAQNLAEVYARTGLAAMDRIEREQELQRQNERLEAFASVVAHDLRNPLNVIRGRAEMARETGDTSHVEAIDRAGERMETIIADVLELTRDGDAVVDSAPVKLTALAESSWANVDTRDATLEVDAMPTVRGDRDRLARLFENLFRNAVEHGPRDVVVNAGTVSDDEGFFVEDDGPGILIDERENVLEEGYSGSNGTGIGLAIVRQIAEAHGWTVRVAESDDGGARFEFRL